MSGWTRTRAAPFSQEFYFLSSRSSQVWAHADVGPGPRWTSLPGWVTPQTPKPSSCSPHHRPTPERGSQNFPI